VKELLSILWGFGRVGLFGFGGGPAMIPLMQEECVERGGWLTSEEFLDALALGNSLPGPISVKMAVAVGFKAEGVLGALAALAGILTPAIVLMLALMTLYMRFRDKPWAQAALRGMRPAVIAMLAWTTIKLAPDGIGDVRAAVLAVAALVALYFQVHPALVVAGSLVLGMLVMR
jgi:chromate transporter